MWFLQICYMVPANLPSFVELKKVSGRSGVEIREPQKLWYRSIAVSVSEHPGCPIPTALIVQLSPYSDANLPII